MKQKNLILIAVAVGCGLVAAFLTTQLGAGQKKVEESIEVPVAAKDLAIGTKLGKDDLKTLITYKKVNKEYLPAEFIQAEDQLADKRLTRMVRAGETFNPKDLTDKGPISPPPGFNVMTFAANAERGVAGFAGPGSKVDVLASIPSRKSAGKATVMPVAIDMLVLAIDTNTQTQQEGAYANMGMVSLAVTNKHAAILHATISRGSDIRLILRHPDHPPVWDHIPTEEEIWAVLADEGDKKGKSGSSSGSEQPETSRATQTVKLPVPVEDLKAGLLLSAEVLSQKFKLVDVVAPAPTGFVQNLKECTGKYLQQDLVADQFLPKSFVGDKPNTAPKPAPAENATPKGGPNEQPQPVKPKRPEDPPVYFDTTVTGSQGVKKYRYQILKDGTYKYLGELKDDGTLIPAKPGVTAPPGGEDNAPRKGERVL